MPVSPHRINALIAVLLALALPAARGVEGPDTLVVCHESLRSELERWVAYRQGQGHRVLVIPPTEHAIALRAEIRRLAKEHPLQHIVLVGDAAGGPTSIPTDYHRARVNVLFGSTPEIATDNSYADLNDDGLPDVALGRWAVRSPNELRTLIDKTLAYESQGTGSDWLRRINLVAGVGGFDPVIERSLEQLTRQFVTQLIPAGFDTRMTYANWASPYCPAPVRFNRATLDRLNEGCLFWVYIGHGSPRGLDYLYTPRDRHRILHCDDVGGLAAEGRFPIAIFLACHTGAFDDRETCLAGEMVNHAGGPIAAVCGTRVTMPYAMSLLSLEMLDEYFYGDAATLGELVRRSKCRMVAPVADSQMWEMRKFIDTAAAWISPRPDLLDAERREHVYLYHLLGDPLLRIPRPQQVPLSVDAAVVAGTAVTVRGTAPRAGRLRVEVCYERGRLSFRPKPRHEYDDSPEQQARYDREYQESLSSVCVEREFDVEAGEFSLTLMLPDGARGAAQVRAILTGEAHYAVGAADLLIERR